MRGLLIKDFNLMKMQRTFFLVVIVMAVVMASSMGNLSFVMGYLGFVIPMFVLSTISYDEFDNGNAFLFTLPISRKLYVVEKYCFCVLLEAGALSFAMIVLLCMGVMMKTAEVSNTLFSAPFLFLIITVIFSVVLPLQFKFGAEKSRFVLIAVSGGMTALGYGIIKVLKAFGVDVLVLMDHLSNVSIWAVLVCLAAVTFGIVCLSVKVSTAIMEKKDF